MPPAPLLLQRARPEDAAALTELAHAAKRHWGYPDAWLQQWRDDLTLSAEFIRANPTFSASADGQLIGTCALRLDGRTARLEHLWVRPGAMHRGVGRALFQQAEAAARAAGATSLKIVSDPHAEGFYLRMGAVLSTRIAAPMDGNPRYLPVLEKPLV